jgi:hypothetical protein
MRLVGPALREALTGRRRGRDGDVTEPPVRRSVLKRTGRAPSAAPRGKAMLAVVAVILVVLWLCGFLVFKVAGGLIHILLVIAVIALIAHFVRGRGAP